MGAKPWRTTSDPLFRGCDDGGPGLPVPQADPSVVRHILYLDGPGRPTPYVSVTEHRETAARFGHGSTWVTSAPTAAGEGFRHLSRKELMDWLKGTGKGPAAWPSAYEVAQARRYVEEHTEHLLDSEPIGAQRVEASMTAAFRRLR